MRTLVKIDRLSAWGLFVSMLLYFITDYNMITVFQNGSHYSHIAGIELTNAFYRRYAKNAITKHPKVGTLK